MNMQNK